MHLLRNPCNCTYCRFFNLRIPPCLHKLVTRAVPCQDTRAVKCNASYRSQPSVGLRKILAGKAWQQLAIFAQGLSQAFGLEPFLHSYSGHAAKSRSCDCLSVTRIVAVSCSKHAFNIGLDVLVHPDVALLVQIQASALQMSGVGLVTDRHE